MPRWAFAVVDAWHSERRAAARHQPVLCNAGGLLDQPAALTDCFALLDGWFAAQQPENGA